MSLALDSSLYLLFYKRKHPKTLAYVSVHDRQNSIIFLFFSYEMCHTFLTLAFSCPLLIFCFAKIYNSVVNGAYSISISIPYANSTHFYVLISLNRREIDKHYLHCLVSMPFWHLANQISIRHALTHFTRHLLVTASFQVSQDPFSSSTIGCHATWLFINLTSLIIISGNM